jgi:hypothetical protein
MGMSGSLLLLSYFIFGKNKSVGTLSNLFQSSCSERCEQGKASLSGRVSMGAAAPQKSLCHLGQ